MIFEGLFCMLQLCCIGLLAVIIFWQILWHSICKIMLPASRDSFTSTFPVWMHFSSLSCLIALVKTSSATLNSSDESSHLCLFLILEKKLPVFSPLSLMSVVGLSQLPFIQVEKLPSSPSLLNGFCCCCCLVLLLLLFYHEGLLAFVKFFFCIS